MILLDTHLLLWSLMTPERLGSRAIEQIETSDRVLFSSISMLEIAIKRLNGRLEAPPDIGRHLAESGFEALVFTPAHASAIEMFPGLARHDPFDRALLGQAFTEGADFMTRDRQLLGLDLDWILDARA